MPKFKIGDKVRILSNTLVDGNLWNRCNDTLGEIGTIIDDDYCFDVRFDNQIPSLIENGGCNTLFFYERDLELITDDQKQHIEERIKYDVTKSLPKVVPVPQERIAGDFVVKDSGERQEFTSGMVRDTAEGKPDYTLAMDGPMFERWVEHLRKGAKKYSKRNWMKAAGQEELDRFRESAFRHFMAWYRGETDEDHASGVYFNLNGAEFVKEKLNGKRNPLDK